MICTSLCIPVGLGVKRQVCVAEKSFLNALCGCIGPHLIATALAGLVQDHDC